MSRRRRVAVAGAVVACLTLTGCSDDSASPDSTTPAAVSTELPIVEQIGDAIAALEAELGGPQEYFEINATARLINLFVALDDATSVQPWLYFNGELTFEELAPAEGGTLRAASVDFDAATIFSKLQAELPGSTIESFYIHGDGQGAVQYGALLTTSQGGAIDVQLSPSGGILSSEPLN